MVKKLQIKSYIVHLKESQSCNLALKFKQGSIQ